MGGKILTLADSPVVGILANPASGRDVRRLVARASVFPTVEKSNMILRMLSAMGSLGVRDVLMMPDTGGIAARVLHEQETAIARHGRNWPRVRFLEMPIEYGEIDTIRAVEQMVSQGVELIIVMGGDGTHRVVSKACGSTPLVALSTGTNNTFPEIREATVAGLAAGLVATGKVRVEEVSSQNKLLHLELGGRGEEIALVDLCVSTECWVGTRALWQPACLRELFVTFASPSSIGLSSIVGYLRPVERWDPFGVRLLLAPPGEGRFTLSVPIAPGLMQQVGVVEMDELHPRQVCAIGTGRGTIAFDGERSVAFTEQDRPLVRLEMEGPITIDIDRVMRVAAEGHLFICD
ncbi:ATP-NAD kinase family protein [Pelobacter propionicus]|uniref:ATP-NAD/AcoX kinase n=1 Tax=Pelobacter propionicus (strain DSM 2379 / NBRC 103807 / OttBd1) TaxID=338966 RepID=A1AMU3_PELPD|nr:NAD(+)/NADH kinase [Pelobacter propionicus]ABK98663.1 ATP-NAD/AcoX kinase [Pelobacter propionicus DSM 2379]